MSSANDRQVGGDHYRSEYQHWDWCIDLNLHYLTSAATKYLTRYREKNGIQDLEKAGHYWAKFYEAAVAGRIPPSMVAEPHVAKAMTAKFIQANEIEEPVAKILMMITAVPYCQHQQEMMERIAVDMAHVMVAYREERNKPDTTGQEHPFGYDEEQDG